MKKFIIFISLFFNTVAFSQPSANGILKWETVTVKKDFILSNSLQYHRFCSGIWKTQIPAFKKENPQVKDVNKFYPGDVIKLQLCENKPYVPFSVKGEVVSKENSYIISEEETTTISTGNSTNSTAVSGSEVTINSEDQNSGYFYLGLGYLTEFAKDVAYSSTSVTLKFNNSVSNNIEYKLLFDLAQPVMFARNQLDFHIINKPFSHIYLNAGLGSRVGLEQRAETDLSNRFTSYSYLGVGYKYRGSKIISDVNAGFSMNSGMTPYLSAMILKRIPSTEIFFGGYFDIQSTSQSINQGRERSFSTGGLLISY